MLEPNFVPPEIPPGYCKENNLVQGKSPAIKETL